MWHSSFPFYCAKPKSSTTIEWDINWSTGGEDTATQMESACERTSQRELFNRRIDRSDARSCTNRSRDRNDVRRTTVHFPIRAFLTSAPLGGWRRRLKGHANPKTCGPYSKSHATRHMCDPSSLLSFARSLAGWATRAKRACTKPTD